MSSAAHGINNAGVVVGSYLTPDSVMHGYIYANGQITTLDAPDSLWTAAYGINDAGVVVGVYGPATPVCHCVDDIEVHGFRWVDGTFTTIDVGLSQTWPVGINGAGTIAGYYNDRDGDIEDHKRGFVLTAGGGLIRVDGPGGGPLSEVGTYVEGINEAGVGVGHYHRDDGTTTPFLWTAAGGVFPLQRFPGTTYTAATGINDSHKVVGAHNFGSTDGGGGFVLAANRFSTFRCPAADWIHLRDVNNKGAMVGTYFQGATSQGFYTLPTDFVEVAGKLLGPDGKKTTVLGQTLATEGRRVEGIAADGVAQVIVRIPASAVGEPVTVTVMSQPSVVSNSPNNYGAVAETGSDCCTSSDVVVFAKDTQVLGPMAFAVYRAPIDFARDGSDANLTTRDVYLRAETASGTTEMLLKIVRPPVALIHGLWDTHGMWKNFSPLVENGKGSDSRFAVLQINFGDPIGDLITDSKPVIQQWWRSFAKRSSLGIEHNANFIRAQLAQELDWFRAGKNPSNIPVAAVQADVVAHSLGGLVTRGLVTRPAYLSYGTFGKGLVHKLITIDTPHLGSPVATRVFQQIANNQLCTPNVLAANSNMPFEWVTLGNGTRQNGAVWDLVHSPMSKGITDLETKALRPIPTAIIAGIYENYDWLDSIFNASVIGLRWLCEGDPLAMALSSEGWKEVMGPESDGIVSRSSQHPRGVGVAFNGVTHSDGMVMLGFHTPTVVSSVEVRNYVIQLLNTPVTDNLFTLFPPQ